MAGWIRLAVRSFAVAALIAAAQLGAAQALSIFTWSAVPAPDIWRRQLMWLVFVFAAAVLGGVAGGRRSVRAIRIAIANRRAIAAAHRHSGLTLHRRGVRAASRRAVAAAKDRTIDTARGFAAAAALVSATLFATLGAAATFALVWLPARNVLDAADLRTLALSAGVGLAVGSVISLLSLAAAPIAANAGTAVIWIWLFGLTSVGIALFTGRPTQTPRLGVLDAPYLIDPDEWWLGPNLMVAVAALFGVGVAAAARWIGARRVGIALSGLAGPALVAAGYLLVGPDGEAGSGYVASLLAATVGLLTSAGTAAAQRGSDTPRQRPSAPAALPAAPVAAYPAALPSGPAPAQSAPRAIEGRRSSAAGRNQLAPEYASTAPLYLAPARSAPVSPVAPVAPPVPPRRRTSAPLTAPSVFSPAPAPTSAEVWPGGLPGPYTAAPVPAPARPVPAQPVRKKPAPPQPVPKKPAPAAAVPAAHIPPPPKAPPKVAAPAAAPAPPDQKQKPPAPQKAPASQKAPAPQQAPAPRKLAGRAGRKAAAQAKAAAQPPVIAAEPVAASSEPALRTARPAEVVAVQSSTTSGKSSAAGATSAGRASQPESRGRLARRRHAKMAERRALEEAAAAAREERLRRRAKALDKREKEHVDWVQNLISLPNDPTLTTRQK